MIEQIFLAPQHTPLGEALTISNDINSVSEQERSTALALEMPLPNPVPGIDKRMQAIGLPIAFSCFIPDLNPVSLDADIAALSRAKYQQAIQLALECRVKYLIIPSLAQPNYETTGQYRPWFGRTVAFWESILEQLPAHHSLTIIMMNEQDSTPDTMATLAKRLNHPAFKTGFDTGKGRLFSTVPPVEWLNQLSDSCAYVRFVNYANDNHSLLPLSDDRQEAPTLASHLALLSRKLSVSLVGDNLNDTKQSYQWIQEFIALQQAQYSSKHFLV